MKEVHYDPCQYEDKDPVWTTDAVWRLTAGEHMTARHILPPRCCHTTLKLSHHSIKAILSWIHLISTVIIKAHALSWLLPAARLSPSFTHTHAHTYTRAYTHWTRWYFYLPPIVNRARSGLPVTRWSLRMTEWKSSNVQISVHISEGGDGAHSHPPNKAQEPVLLLERCCDAAAAPPRPRLRPHPHVRTFIGWIRRWAGRTDSRLE